MAGRLSRGRKWQWERAREGGVHRQLRRSELPHAPVETERQRLAIVCCQTSSSSRRLKIGCVRIVPSKEVASLRCLLIPVHELDQDRRAQCGTYATCVFPLLFLLRSTIMTNTEWQYISPLQVGYTLRSE